MKNAGFVLTFLVAVMTLSAQKIDRTKPPQTPPMAPFKLPSVQETVLPNGLRVVLVEDRRLPMVTVRLGFEAGSKFDPQEAPGLAQATASLLTEGTKSRTSREIADQLAEIGGALKADAGADTLTVSGRVLAENLPRLLELLAEVSLNASFPEEEVKLYRSRRTQELIAARSRADYWADEKIAAVVFGPHPYARINPTLESVASLKREDVAAFRDRHLVSNNAVLVLLGAIPPRQETLELVRSRFGSWRKGDLPVLPSDGFPPPRPSLTLVDRPGSVQADIRVGRLAVDRLSPDYFPLVVANTILGGGTSSRMFMNIREKQGFAYDAHSRLEPRKQAGLFVAVTQVRAEVLEPALKALFSEMEALAAAPVSASELENARNYRSGRFLMSMEAQDNVADQLLATRLLGLPPDYLETFTARVQGVTAEQVRQAAGKYFSPQAAGVVVVGDAAQIRKPLEKFGKVTLEKAE